MIDVIEITVNSATYGKQSILLDKEDLPKIQGFSLYVHKAGQFLYVRLSPGKISLHRLVMEAPKGMVIDHINRNTLDNRKSNLRITTIQKNLWNQKRPNNKTGITGVAVHKHYGYTAQIKVDYKKIHLGSFKTIEEATRIRKEAEKKYHVF